MHAHNKQSRRYRTVKANKEKRLRYNRNKKSRKPRKDSATGQDIDGYSSLKDSEYTTTDGDASVCSMSTSYPGKDRFDTLKFQDENSRLLKEEKLAQLQKQYGSFCDASPCFPSDDQKIKLPECLMGIERVEIKAKIDELLKKENNALFQARFFRNRCSELEEQVRKLETEKEGIRFFWRNQVLEGQSRAGKILKLATSAS